MVCSFLLGPGFPGILAFLAAGEDRGDLCLGCSLVAGIKNTTADFLVDGIVAVGVALNEPHFARVPLVNLACQGRVVSSASHGGSPFFGPALPGVLGYCAAGARLPLRLKLSRSRLSASSALYPSRWLASSAPVAPRWSSL